MPLREAQDQTHTEGRYLQHINLTKDSEADAGQQGELSFPTLTPPPPKGEIFRGPGGAPGGVSSTRGEWSSREWRFPAGTKGHRLPFTFEFW